MSKPTKVDAQRCINAEAPGNLAEPSMKFGIRLKIIAIVAPIIPVLITFFVLLQAAQQQSETLRGWIDHTYEMTAQINTLLSDMQDAETGQRGFIITNDESFLEPYNWSIKKVDSDLNRLHEMAAQQQEQQEQQELDSLIRKKIAFMADIISIRKEQGLTAAAERISKKTGKDLMDNIWRIMRDMISEENRLLAMRKNEFKQTTADQQKIEAAAVAGLLLMYIIMTMLLIRSIMTPLRTLKKGTLMLGRGEYTVRLNSDRNDEFGELTQQFNRMAKAMEDRTEERAAALARAEESDRIKSAILAHAGHAIIATTTEGIITTFNPAAERMLGYSAAEMIGLMTPALFHDPQEVETRAEQFSVELGETIEPGFEVFVTRSRRNLPNEYEWTYLCKNGTRFPVLLSVTALRDAAGEITGFLGMAIDITEQKLIQRELANNEARLSSVIDTAVEGIITINSHGMVETMNPAAETVFGYLCTEVIGQNIKMLMPEPYHSQHDGYLLNYLTTGQAKVIGIGREVVGRRKDGSVFPMELAVSEMSINGKRMFTGLVRDITERKEMERMKNEFISTVSHELRTPLTSIRGSLGLVLGGATGELPEKSKQLLTIANNNCARLVRLINEILDIEKFESGQMVFDLKPLEIMPLVRHTLDSNQAYADEFGVTFAVTGEAPGVFVLADNDRLIQVLTNLLSNAAKFSPHGGRVDVSVSATGQCLRLSVTDYGTGIKEEFKSQIFKKFSQEDASNTRQKGGTGLGLNICKVIVEKLGGQIAFESKVNKSTCFYVDLPVWREAPVPMIPDAAEHAQEQVLILEDDPDVANLLRMMLKKNGHTADIAYNAEQAKQLLKNKRYDAMTLDLMLPGQSGVDFFRELRALEQFQNLPVIVVSAIADKGRQELNGEALQVIDWLDKPIDEDRLQRAVSQAFRQNGKLPRILHVEDDPDIVHIVGAMLRDAAEVDVAPDLATAREKLQQDYDLVILDLSLPDGSGETLLPLLSQRDKAIPVLIFSAKEIELTGTQQVTATFVKSKTSNEILINTIESILKSKR